MVRAKEEDEVAGKAGLPAVNNDVAQYIKATSSKETAFKHLKVMLIGSQGVGKTVTAHTISKQCPETLPAKEWTTVSDTATILFDNNGADSLYHMKLEVPRKYDLSVVPGPMLRQVLSALFREQIVPAVKSGEIENLIVDSISSLDTIFKIEASKTEDNWDWLIAAHAEFNARLRELPCNVVMVAHGKAVETARTKKDGDAIAVHEARLEADGLSIGGVQLDITGQSVRFFRRNWSEIWPVYAVGDGDNKKVNIYPHGVPGIDIEHKTRMRGLAQKEPPNIRGILNRALENRG